MTYYFVAKHTISINRVCIKKKEAERKGGIQ